MRDGVRWGAAVEADCPWVDGLGSVKQGYNGRARQSGLVPIVEWSGVD